MVAQNLHGALRNVLLLKSKISFPYRSFPADDKFMCLMWEGKWKAVRYFYVINCDFISVGRKVILSFAPFDGVFGVENSLGGPLNSDSVKEMELRRVLGYGVISGCGSCIRYIVSVR